MSGNTENSTGPALFVDVDEKDDEITNEVALGSWQTVRGPEGFMIVPTRSSFGKDLMSKGLGVDNPPAGTYETAQHLSSLPQAERNRTLGLIKALLMKD